MTKLRIQADVCYCARKIKQSKNTKLLFVHLEYFAKWASLYAIIIIELLQGCFTCNTPYNFVECRKS